MANLNPESNRENSFNLEAPHTTHFGLNLICCLIFVSIVISFSSVGKPLLGDNLLLLGLLCFLPQFGYEIIRQQNLGTKLKRLDTRSTADVCRQVSYKLTGLYVTLSVIAFCYWLFPIYQQSFYAPYRELLERMWVWLVIGAIPYFYLIERYIDGGDDAYSIIGKWLTLKKPTIERSLILEHTRAWIIKGFFLPLMYCYLNENLLYLSQHSPFLLVTPSAWFSYLHTFIFTIDLFFTTAGYIFTFRIFNGQIRSSDSTWLGWIVCIICYQPFWGAVIQKSYLNYDDGLFWGDMFSGNSSLYLAWGGCILAIEFIYALATVSFGYRFSNLSYRGIITNGPYAFTKHPAYVCKNISWWLISVPFVSLVSWEEALRCSLLLVGVNLIYFLRARTEEHHLSQYPEYVAYALKMNSQGIFSFLSDYISALRYKAPPQTGSQ